MPANKTDKQLYVKRFKQAREAHQLEITEDYVEMIADLIIKHGEARAVDLAQRFGVTNATVSNTVARLQRNGLVVSKPYRSIFLTEQGRILAKETQIRHQIVLDFLISIGVSPEVAEIDAEGLEHHVSKETLQAFKRLIKNGSVA